MTIPSFNVLKDPWIPVIRKDGVPDELGIQPCLEQAHELKEIRDPAPIIEFGIYRLLIAFVLDALIHAGQRPEVPLDLKLLINQGQFDIDMIEKYIEHCGDVFDIFHPERPFLQTKMDNASAQSLAGMFPVTPSGTNVRHWHHKSEDSFIISASEATRLLTTIAPFMTAGGAGLSPSINGAPAIYALPSGKSIFETLLLNIPIRSNQDSGDGVIAWLRKRSPGQERSHATTIESLTWSPRCLQLLPDLQDTSDIQVCAMKFKKGDSTRFTWIDANLAYRYDKDKVTPVRMREGRPLWRDAGPLLLLNESEHGRSEQKVLFRRPDVVEQAFKLIANTSPLMIQVYGMRTDMKMKVYEWAKSVLLIPVTLGRSTRLGSLVQQELDHAEQVAFYLRTYIRNLFPREGAGNKKALSTITNRCERIYWQRLENHFQPLMDAFAVLDPNAPDDPDFLATTAKDWREAIYNLALEQFEAAAEDMDADSDALQRQVNARSFLNKKLKEVLS